MTIRVALAGAHGTMGTLFDSILSDIADVEVVARLGRSSSLDELDHADLVVDVTHPEASRAIVEHAARNGAQVLVGTSGWSESRIAELRGSIPDDAGVLIIPNFSLGSVLGTTLATIAARFYSSIEIVESHRASKADSPSGTAVRTAELMTAARAGLGPVEAPHTEQRARGQEVAGIPVHSVRRQGVVARQEVLFGGTGETLSVIHDTVDPSAYERGIRLSLDAVRTVRGLVVGLENVLDLGITRA
ncbi:4-hydroxy-tetrahydrodipicolinate reductase [Paramicrobacterium agarici]|uniref:4-hydroxy-tetrahydrodipicolinate reductase n=1 Tax=Paramicrobacterium agarici TaxID=630514 RepID=A0A2A9DYH6_9MICO|nr:4-hydroxy-tetrahydrodipicolinate reductase [Microbacterium agarici]PFG31032.1 dihydrodipicolinate reductase [Microbacterium agarici]